MPASCAHAVRARSKADYEHYLCGLLLPAHVQAPYFALRAFNIETARIRQITSDGHTASGRFVFWRETVRAMGAGRGPPAGQRDPVVRALADAVARFRLPRRWLERVIESRAADAVRVQPISLAELEAYAEGTGASLAYATLELLGVRDVPADHVASHVGKACAIALVLRGTPHHLARMHSYIPVEVATKHGLATPALLADRGSAQLCDAVLQVATVGKQHLDHASELLGSTAVPALARRVFLPGVLARRTFAQLERVSFDVFAPQLQRRDALLQLRLAYHAYRGTF